MTQQTPPEDRPPRRSRRHRADRTAPPAQPPASAGESSAPREEPRYGMLLPPGESIDRYIVPQRPGARREHDGRTRHGGGAHTRRSSGPARAAWEAPRGQDRQPVFPAHHPSSGEYVPPTPSAQGAYAGPGAGAPPDPRAAREEQERRRRRGRATVMAIIGGLLMVFAPLIGLAVTTVQSLDSAMADVLAAEPLVNGGSLDLPADTGLAITAATARELTQCTVTDPDGAEVPVSVADSAPTREGTAAVSGARFRTQGAGEYTVACGDVAEDARLTVGPPVVVRPDGTGWATAGIVLGALGAVLLVVGLVLRSRLKG